MTRLPPSTDPFHTLHPMICVKSNCGWTKSISHNVATITLVGHLRRGIASGTWASERCEMADFATIRRFSLLGLNFLGPFSSWIPGKPKETKAKPENATPSFGPVPEMSGCWECENRRNPKPFHPESESSHLVAAVELGDGLWGIRGHHLRKMVGQNPKPVLPSEHQPIQPLK